MKQHTRTVFPHLILAAAVGATLAPSAAPAATTKTVATATGTRVNWLTSGNWNGGIMAGTATVGSGATFTPTNGAADDLFNVSAATASAFITSTASGSTTTSFFGVNFGSGSAGLNGGTMTLGSIVSDATKFGSANAANGTLQIGNDGSVGMTSNTAAITGTYIFTGNTVDVSNAGTNSMDNIVLATRDGSTGNLSFVNQTYYSTNTGVTATTTYLLGNTTSTIYTTAGTSISFNSSKVGESVTGAALNKYGAGTLALGSATNTFSGGLNIYGGTTSATNPVGFGTGAILINGGTLATAGTSSTAITQTYLTQAITIGANGGTISIPNANISWGASGAVTATGRLTIQGGSSTPTQLFVPPSTASIKGGLTVTGGAIYSTGYTAPIGTPASFMADAIKLDNGGLRSTVAGNFTIPDNVGITVGAGGGLVNIVNSGAGLSFNNVVSDGSTSGTLTTAGSGTITFRGTNTYTGATSVTSGILRDNGTHSNAGSYTVAAAASYGGAGRVTLASGNSMTINGTLIPGSTASGIGTLTVNGDVALPGTFAADASATTIDKLAVSGLLDLTGGKLVVTGALPTDGTALILATYGTETGTFSSVTLPSGYTGMVDYAYNGLNQVALIASTPEPASIAVLALGGIGLLRRRRLV